MTLALYENVDDYEAEYLKVRVAFIARGTTLNAWLLDQQINRQLAYKALRGQSLGRKALETRRRILREAFAQGEA